jgi:hypothetical protein
MNLNNVEYRISKLNARKQFHVMRRLAPVISDIAPFLKGMDLEHSESDKGYAMIAPLGKALANLKDEDADFILDTLLDAVTRDAGNGLGFTPIRLNGVNMFSDITMASELKLAFEVIKDNFKDFLPEIRSILTQEESLQREQ